MAYYRNGPTPKGYFSQMMLVFTLIVGLITGHFELLFLVPIMGIIIFILKMKNEQEEEKRKIEETRKRQQSEEANREHFKKISEKRMLEVSIEYTKDRIKRLEESIAKNDKPNANPNIGTENDKKRLKDEKLNLEKMESELLELEKSFE